MFWTEREESRMIIPTTQRGFTLIELVMVIAILGILAAVALPKFQDLSGAAKVAATKGGLGAVRSTLAIKYAQSATGGAVASFPASLTGADFADGQLPKNALNSAVRTAIVTTASTNFTDTANTNGFWYISSTGQAGAFPGTAAANTSDF